MKGWLRSDGRKGIRNVVAVAYLVECAHHVAREIAVGVWPAFVKPAGLDSDILGTVATQGISRKDKENRDSSYGFKKQKRMWRDRMYAFKHLYF